MRGWAGFPQGDMCKKDTSVLKPPEKFAHFRISSNAGSWALYAKAKQDAMGRSKRDG
jgi:hypothetical protein